MKMKITGVLSEIIVRYLIIINGAMYYILKIFLIYAFFHQTEITTSKFAGASELINIISSPAALSSCFEKTNAGGDGDV